MVTVCVHLTGLSITHDALKVILQAITAPLWARIYQLLNRQYAIVPLIQAGVNIILWAIFSSTYKSVDMLLFINEQKSRSLDMLTNVSFTES